MITEECLHNIFVSPSRTNVETVHANVDTEGYIAADEDVSICRGYSYILTIYWAR